MEKNEDPNIVIMDRARLDFLYSLAEMGAHRLDQERELKYMRKHLRRFNLSLREEAAKGRKAAEESYRAKKAAAYAFVNQYLGQEVYLYLNASVITRAIVLSCGRKHKTCVYVKFTSPEYKGQSAHRQDVLIDGLRVDLPEDWVQEVEGYWKGYWRHHRPS